jgi:hypothetical protein
MSDFLKAMKAVFWSFFGVRKGADYDKDRQQLKPVHVIIAGLIGAALFIGLLVMLVKVAVAQ